MAYGFTRANLSYVVTYSYKGKEGVTYPLIGMDWNVSQGKSVNL